MKEPIWKPTTAAEALKNAKISAYKDGSFRLTVFSRPVFYADGFTPVRSEEEKKKLKEFKERMKHLADEEGLTDRERADNLRRAKKAIYDIAALNDWSYFVTLTIDKEKADRYNAKELVKPISKWLQNMVQRRALKYLIVPELHKDGAIHFHGLVSDGLHMVDSGTRRVKGHKKPLKLSTLKRMKIPEEDTQIVYNIEDFHLGFSSAIPIYGEREALSRYMTKYILKDLGKIFGNYYFAGGSGLHRKPFSSAVNLDFDAIHEKAYPLPEGLGFVKYLYIPSFDALSDLLDAAAVEQLKRGQVLGWWNSGRSK